MEPPAIGDHELENSAALLSLSRAARRFMRRASKVEAELAAALDLHSTDLMTLELLHTATQPVTPKMVAEYLGLSTGSATGALDRIERAGLARREPHPTDRRGAVVTPQPHSVEALARMQRDFLHRHGGALADFTAEELAITERVLHALADSARDSRGAPQGPWGPRSADKS